MKPAQPLPVDLGPAFHVRDGIKRGMSRASLTRSDLRAPFHGVRVRVGEGAVDVSLLGRCREYAPRLAPTQFFSHETALQILGAPMPQWPYVAGIHVSTHRPAREPRVRGVTGHRLQLRESATLLVDGLPIEHPVRAWRQCGRLWRLDALIAAGDHLVSGPTALATIDELSTEVEVMGDTASGILRRALAEVRTGVRSPRETDLRLLLVRAGLPEPEVAVELRDERGGLIAEMDLGYRRWRVAPEYDGRVHAEDARQFAKDADRWDAIRAAGWDHVRILNHHMAGSGVAAVVKVRTALLRAGWQPGASQRAG